MKSYTLGIYTTTDRPEETNGCDLETERKCADGTCVLSSKLCEQEEILNQNTILIMIVIGMAVVVFLIILYCFQQKTRRPNRNSSRGFEAGLEDGDNASLYNPPPTYNEVVTSTLYPPTPQSQRVVRIPSSDEPITPPPNYQAALKILAQSHESILVNKTSKSYVFRRSVSVDSIGRQNRTSTSTEPTSPTTQRLPFIFS